MAEGQKVEQKQTLYQMVMDKVDLARNKVDELREKLKDFDAMESTSAGREKASAYFSLALDKAQEALADLTKQAQTLKDNATEIPVRAFSTAFARANDALSDVKDQAKSFDEQHQLSSKVSDIINHPWDQAAVAVASASSYVADAAHSAYAQLQGVSDGIKCRVMAAAEQGIDKVMPVVASYDEKLHIAERSSAAKDVLVHRVKEFDSLYHVSDKLVDLDNRWAVSGSFASALSSLGQLDQRITGGKVEPAVTSTYELGLQMAGFLRGKFEESKSKAEAAISDAAAPPPAAPAAPAPAAPAAAAPAAPAAAAPEPEKAESS